MSGHQLRLDRAEIKRRRVVLAVDTMVDKAEREASLGYAWFWMFLSLVGIVFGVLSWMISKGKLGNLE